VDKLKEAMVKWSNYIKAESEEDIKTFLQKKATAISEEKTHNNGKYHEATSIKRGPKTVCDSNQNSSGQTAFRRRFQSYIS
jgi:hypothetical protein